MLRSSRAGRVAAGSGGVLFDHALRRVAAVVIAGSIMSVLDLTIVNIAFDRLSERLHAPVSSIQWVATAYMLAIATILPITAWAARRLGTRRLFVLSLTLFTCGSALCGFAWSAGSLIAFRAIQGLGGGMLAPVGQMILVGAAGPRRMARVLTVANIPVSLAPIFGPTLGGVILDQLSWRWIFFVNLPVGAVAIALSLRLLPRSRAVAAGPLDAIGLALLGAGLPVLTYGLTRAGGAPTSPGVVLPIAGGLLLVLTFIVRSLRIRHPLLDLRLFRDGAFATSAATTFMLSAGVFGALVLLPLYLQSARGLSPVATGLLMMPQSIALVLFMPFAGRIADRIGGGIVGVSGITIAVIGTVPFAFADAGLPLWLLSVSLFVRGAGIGIAAVPAFAAAFRSLRPHQIEDATPQLGVLQRIGASLGLAILSIVVAGRTGIRHGGGRVEQGAYADAFVWSICITALSLLPLLALARIERRDLRPAEDGR